ncbi:aspartic peptidase domain-containing protein [Xylaria digitata]|nr:aspartic peptidase domain-containing protein [Xylaria digitata]
MGLAHGQGNGFAKYPLIIDSLAAQNFTNTKLFSMDLGRQVSPGGAITGELVFGGVDTNRYSGLLKKVPTDPSDPHYRVTLNSLAHRAPGATVALPFIDANLPVSVIVDSGTTLSLLPESVVSKLAAQFPGAQPDGAGGYRVDCAYQGRDGSVDFSFLAGTGTVTVNVAYNDFIWNSGGDCFLGAWSSNDLGVWILGDTFLRGAYVTFDQTNNALFMSNYVSCGDGQSNLVTVPAGPDAAANIPGACSAVSVSNPPTSPATFPSGTPSSTAIPPSLGPSLNPLEPSPAASTSSHLPPSSYRIDATSAPVSSPVAAADPNAHLGSGTGANPKAHPALSGSGVPITTVTATVTRGVVYTVTACPDSVKNCPLRGHVATRFKTVVTTFCPEHGEMPSVTTDAGGAVFVIESSPPASTLVPEIEDTIASGWDEEGLQQIDDLQEYEPLQQEGQVVTTAFPTTTIYKITSCSTEDTACTMGMTTTRVITLSKTVVVHPMPTASSLPGNNGFAPASNNASVPWNTTVAISAAPVDDGQIDKRYLGAVFVVVWGVMVLL